MLCCLFFFKTSNFPGEFFFPLPTVNFKLVLAMKFDPQDFVDEPTLDKVHCCMKEQLLLLVRHYDVHVSRQMRKQKITSDLLLELRSQY